MTYRNLVLRLRHCGTPIQWLPPNVAATLIVKNQVVWFSGETVAVLRGGKSKSGERSQLALPAIIATQSRTRLPRFSPALSNALLFRRDRFVCLYCGNRFAGAELSRDHVVPRAQGGADIWENVVTACKPCNHRKDCRTPEQAGMPLLAVPYKPNIYEFTVLANHRILADQMQFLSKGLSARFHFM